MVEWRYVSGGAVRHAIWRPDHGVAMCGFGPMWFDYWRGTGSQLEYEECARRPACKSCVRRGADPTPPVVK